MKKTIPILIIALIILFFPRTEIWAVSNTDENVQFEDEFGAFEGSKASENFNLQDSARGFTLKGSGQLTTKEDTDQTSTETGRGGLWSSSSLAIVLPIVIAILIIALLIFILLKRSKNRTETKTYSNI